MHDLNNFGLGDVVGCGAALRRMTQSAASMEEAANAIVQYLYESVSVNNGQPALALVRFFKTHAFAGLLPEQQAQAQSLVRGLQVEGGMKCLTLLATRGDEPDWNSRLRSRGHAAIPLPSETIVEKAPMIAQLVQQLGLDIGTVLSPDREAILDLAQKTYNVFYVEDANGNAYIPGQDFVIRYGIRSVLGFGGMLPSGNLFAVIMFAKVVIPRETADLFANVALAAKLAVLPFDGRVTFAAAG